MSDYINIEEHLAESFQDFKLSQDEKYSLRDKSSKSLLVDCDSKEKINLNNFMICIVF